MVFATYLLAVSLTRQFAGDLGRAHAFVKAGVLFQTAHMAPVWVVTESGGRLLLTPFSMAEHAGWPLLVLVVPPLLLFPTGAVLESRAAADRAARAAAAGSVLALGYAPLAAASAVVVSGEYSGSTAGFLSSSARVGLETTPEAILVGAVVHPAAFGALGGLASVAVRHGSFWERGRWLGLNFDR